MTAYAKVTSEGEIVTQQEGIEIAADRLNVVDPDDNCTWIAIDGFKDHATTWWNGTSWQTRELATLPFCAWKDGQWQQASEHVAMSKAAVQKSLRAYREKELWRSDWTQMPDSPLNSTQKAEWATYRQQLRDLPATEGDRTDLAGITYPQAPDAANTSDPDLGL